MLRPVRPRAVLRGPQGRPVVVTAVPDPRPPRGPCTDTGAPLVDLLVGLVVQLVRLALPRVWTIGVEAHGVHRSWQVTGRGAARAAQRSVRDAVLAGEGLSVAPGTVAARPGRGPRA